MAPRCDHSLCAVRYWRRVQCSVGQNRTGGYGIRQYSTQLDNAAQRSAGRDRRVRHGKVQYTTVQYSTPTYSRGEERGGRG
eukprot:2996461-Rhodomonas_salina.1